MGNEKTRLCIDAKRGTISKDIVGMGKEYEGVKANS